MPSHTNNSTVELEGSIKVMVFRPGYIGATLRGNPYMYFQKHMTVWKAMVSGPILADSVVT